MFEARHNVHIKYCIIFDCHVHIPSAEKPTLTLTRDPEYDVMFAGEVVTFSCAISVQSEWTYLWYKDGSKVTGSSDKLIVQIRKTTDQGLYTCKATRGQNSAFNTDSSEAKQLKVQGKFLLTLLENICL